MMRAEEDYKGGGGITGRGGGVGGRGGGGGGGGVGRGGNELSNSIVRNPEYKFQLFNRFSVLAIRVRDVLRNSQTPPPLSPLDTTNNTTMCVAYHVKGMCNERCGRAIDHDAHTAAHDNGLVEWCNAHYVIP